MCTVSTRYYMVMAPVMGNEGFLCFAMVPVFLKKWNFATRGLMAGCCLQYLQNFRVASHLREKSHFLVHQTTKTCFLTVRNSKKFLCIMERYCHSILDSHPSKQFLKALFLFVDRNYMNGNKNLNTIVFVFQFANSVKKLRGSGSANLFGRKHPLPQHSQT